MKKKRTLYDCSSARVKGQRIYCNKGYSLATELGDGGLDIRHLEKGEPLAVKICRQCSDFDRMGPPLPEEDRGWLKTKVKEVERRNEIDFLVVRTWKTG